MSLRFHLALRLAIAVLLAALALVGGPARRPSGMAPLLELDPASVNAIEVISERGTTIIRRTARGWVIDSDGGVPARDDRITLLLADLAGARTGREVTVDPARFGQFGIDERSARVRLHTATDAVVVTAGAESPAGGYLRVAGGPVVESDSGLRFFLGQPRSYWEYLRLFPEDVSAQSVVAARLSTGSEDREIRRGVDPESWEALTPAGASAAGRPAVIGLLRELADMVGSAVVDPREAEGLPEAGRFSLWTADGREYAAVIYRRPGDLLAVPSGPRLPGEPYGGFAYALPDVSFERIARAASQLPSR